jgi:ABC-type phosphate/phosphonate transport system substrate-binding protein
MAEAPAVASPRIMNARMYAVTPQAEAAWRALLEHVTAEAGADFRYLPYPAPQPLEDLWTRPDLGTVFMCGYPMMLGVARVVPLAAPIPRAAWAEGRARYRTDLIVRADAPYRRLEDTFGGHAGWTVEHSHSGFNALRHHLLPYRSATRPHLYGQMSGHLITARKVLDSVREGRIDIGPLDAYWHLLIARDAPELTRGIRILTSTESAPMPAFVTAAGTDPKVISALRAAFVATSQREWFAPLASTLQLAGFAGVSLEDYQVLREWERAALAAGYPLPA